MCTAEVYRCNDVSPMRVRDTGKHSKIRAYDVTASMSLPLRRGNWWRESRPFDSKAHLDLDQ